MIKTKQFTIRKFKLSDAAELTQAINDKMIINNLAVVPFPYKIKDANWFIKKNLNNYKDKKATSIGYCIEINKKCVGGIGFSELVAGHKVTIGYWLARDYWGKGLMTKIVRSFTNYIFKKYKLKRIEARVFLYNPASKRVLEKTGFQLEGVLRKVFKKGDKYLDEYLLSKIKK